MRNKNSVLAIASILLTACGGGSSGGGETTNPDDSGGGSSLSQLEISTGTLTKAAASLDLIQYPAELGVLSISTPDLLGSANEKLISCNGDTHYSPKIITIEASRLTQRKWSNGDQIAIDFPSDCQLSGLYYPVSGRITMTIAMADSSSEKISHAEYHIDTSQLSQTYTDDTNNTYTIEFDGALIANIDVDGAGKTTLQMNSDSARPFTLANYYRLENYTYSGSWNEQDAKYSITTNAHIALLADNKYVDIKTTSPITGQIGELPSTGSISITGKNNTYLNLVSDSNGMVNVIGKGSDFSDSTTDNWQQFMSGGLLRYPTQFDIEERVHLANFGETKAIWSTMKFDSSISKYNNSYDVLYSVVYELADVGTTPQLSVLINHKSNVTASFNTDEDPLNGSSYVEAVTHWEGQRLFISPIKPLLAGTNYSLSIYAGQKNLGTLRFKTDGNYIMPSLLLDAGNDEFAIIGQDKTISAAYIDPNLQSLYWWLDTDVMEGLTLQTLDNNSARLVNSAAVMPGRISRLALRSTYNTMVSTDKDIQYINSNQDKTFISIDSVNGISKPKRNLLVGGIGHEIPSVYHSHEGFRLYRAFSSSMPSEAMLTIAVTPTVDTDTQKVYHFSNKSQANLIWNSNYQSDYSTQESLGDTIDWSTLCSNSELTINYVDPTIDILSEEAVAVNYQFTCLDNDVRISGRIRKHSQVE